MLLQGGSGAGKSRTMRRIVEEAFDYVQTMIVDPEGEFGNLAAHIGATTLKAAEIAADGLTAAAARARHHRIALHLDLTDLDPEQRIIKASAFFAGLVGAPREDWKHTVLVAIDEGHLLAPHLAGSARDAETRRLGVATLTDLCARGRKRGIAPIIATQRLAKLSSSVVSELQNFLIGINVFDRDIARAADILGFPEPRPRSCARSIPANSTRWVLRCPARRYWRALTIRSRSTWARRRSCMVRPTSIPTKPEGCSISNICRKRPRRATTA